MRVTPSSYPPPGTCESERPPCVQQRRTPTSTIRSETPCNYHKNIRLSHTRNGQRMIEAKLAIVHYRSAIQTTDHGRGIQCLPRPAANARPFPVCASLPPTLLFTPYIYKVDSYRVTSHESRARKKKGPPPSPTPPLMQRQATVVLNMCVICFLPPPNASCKMRGRLRPLPLWHLLMWRSQGMKLVPGPALASSLW